MIKLEINSLKELSVTKKTKVFKGENLINSIEISAVNPYIGDKRVEDCEFFLHVVLPDSSYIVYPVEWSLNSIPLTGFVPITYDITSAAQILKLYIEIKSGSTVIGKSNIIELQIFDSPNEVTGLMPREQLEEELESASTLTELLEELKGTYDSVSERLSADESQIAANTSAVTANQSVLVSTAAALNNKLDDVDSEIHTNHIADSAVTNAKLASSAVTQAKLADSSVTGTKINNGAVTTAKIADEAVTTAKLDSNSVTIAKMADGAVDEDVLCDGAVKTAKINDGAVTNSKLAASAVYRQNILDAAVNKNKLADDAVETDKIKNFAVTTAKIDDSAVTVAKINDGAVTNAKLDSSLQAIIGRVPTTPMSYESLGIQNSSNYLNNSSFCKPEGEWHIKVDGPLANGIGVSTGTYCILKYIESYNNAPQGYQLLELPLTQRLFYRPINVVAPFAAGGWIEAVNPKITTLENTIGTLNSQLQNALNGGA